jgi:hypothetical protein
MAEKAKRKRERDRARAVKKEPVVAEDANEMMPTKDEPLLSPDVTRPFTVKIRYEPRKMQFYDTDRISTIRF